MRKTELQILLNKILALNNQHVIRIGIDGVSASGKTTLANELKLLLEKSGKNVIRSSVDGFHNPPEIRYKSGKNSPIGYYKNSFDYDSIISDVLNPLSPKGNGLYKVEKYNFKNEEQLTTQEEKATKGSILIFEGVFLFRKEINNFWDFRIFVDINFDIAIERAYKRDLHHFGSIKTIKDKYMNRYIPGQQHYLDTVNPSSKADLIVKNDFPEKPEFIYS